MLTTKQVAAALRSNTVCHTVANALYGAASVHSLANGVAALHKAGNAAQAQNAIAALYNAGLIANAQANAIPLVAFGGNGNRRNGKANGGGNGRTSFSPNAVITVLAKGCPKRPNTIASSMWAVYSVGQTVAQFVAKAALVLAAANSPSTPHQWLKHDLAKGFIAIN